tara:strand:- start:227 stop:634 length:408 start_codon:yes stop_codon:yes gene_type:complete
MAKVQKQFVTPKWVEIKEMYEKGTNGSDKYGTNFELKGELDVLASEFVDILGELTRQFGWGCVIEDIKMDLWKERIWSLIENAGLLPEIAWRDDLAKDEEIAAKKAESDAYFKDEFEDMDEYEPSDSELLETEDY